MSSMNCTSLSLRHFRAAQQIETLSEEVSRRVTDGRDKKGHSFPLWARATHSAKRGYPGSMYHMIKRWAEAAASPIRFSDSGENFAS